MPSFVLDPTIPFRITTPADATVQAGEIIFSLASIRSGSFGPVDVELNSAGTLRAIRWVPNFAGTLTSATATLSGATLTVGPATVVIAVAGVAATLSAAISFPVTSAAGTTQSVTVTAGGAFIATQEIRITPGGTNTAIAFAGVVLGYTRA